MEEHSVEHQYAVCVCAQENVQMGTVSQVSDNVKDLCEYVCNVLILDPAGHGTSPMEAFIMMVKSLSPLLRTVVTPQPLTQN